MPKRFPPPGVCAVFAAFAAVVVARARVEPHVGPTTAPALADGAPASAPATRPSPLPPVGPGGQHTFADFAGRSGIVFLCDRDVTMGHSFEALKNELAAAACAVRPGQSLNILFLSDGAPQPLGRDGMLRADETTPRRVLEFLNNATTESTPTRSPDCGRRSA